MSQPRRSKFQSIFDEVRQPVEETATVEAVPTPEPLQPEPTIAKRGRPSGGKRSDPSYELVSAYLKRDTYRQVQIALLQAGRKREFSDLLEELLLKWLQEQG